MELKERNTKIYLICGKARHGKTTIGKMIKEYYTNKGKEATVTLLALYLKTYVKQFFGSVPSKWPCTGSYLSM